MHDDVHKIEVRTDCLSVIVFRVLAPNDVYGVIPNMSFLVDLVLVVLNKRHHSTDMEDHFVECIGVVNSSWAIA